MIILVLFLALVGCASEAEIETTYGRRRGSSGESSINGTAVLSEMFRAAGYRVSSRKRLTPSIRRSDVIIWIPDDFEPPSEEVRMYLEEWLGDEDGRTLVYVGRDFDASSAYWEKVAPRIPPEQLVEASRRRAMAQSIFDSNRRRIPDEKDVDWFVCKRSNTTCQATQLGGPWSDAIDSDSVDIELRSRLEPPTAGSGQANWANTWSVTKLLVAGDASVVARLQRPHWHDSQIVIVSNGSFLLNLPLVNQEHRKLAGMLIDQCGPSGRATFLESGPNGPVISNREAQVPYMLRYLTIWPWSCILIHFALLGILFCFYQFPILGTPKDLPKETQTDFGDHVQALGNLLAKTQDESYARSKIDHYHQYVKHEPPSSSTEQMLWANEGQ